MDEVLSKNRKTSDVFHFFHSVEQHDKLQHLSMFFLTHPICRHEVSKT